MKKHDICEFCDGEIEHRSIRARFNFKGQTIYVDNVPAWVCPQCGEQYFDAPIYKRLEEIAKHQNQIINTVCFPLAEYNMAISQ
jgi:YgiT-type zinc finger domain-containing protein